MGQAAQHSDQVGAISATEQGAQYGISYAGARKPHAIQVESAASLQEAQLAFARAKLNKRIGEPTLLGPEKVLESYATKGGNVLVLVKEPDGYFRTDLWRATPHGLYAETILLTENKSQNTRQLMATFSGMCAAERALEANSRANVQVA